MTEDERIGSILRSRREKLGLSLSALGSRIGVSGQAIQKIETGKTRLNGRKAAELANVLGLAPQQLFHAGLRDERFNFLRTRREAESFLDAALALSHIRDRMQRKRLLDEAKKISKAEQAGDRHPNA